jgi:hypothetical protein
MAPLAVLLLTGLMWFGPQFGGWTDYNNHIRIALIAAFMFGVLFGWGASRQR